MECRADFELGSIPPGGGAGRLPFVDTRFVERRIQHNPSPMFAHFDLDDSIFWPKE